MVSIMDRLRQASDKGESLLLDWEDCRVMVNVFNDVQADKAVAAKHSAAARRAWRFWVLLGVCIGLSGPWVARGALWMTGHMQ